MNPLVTVSYRAGGRVTILSPHLHPYRPPLEPNLTYLPITMRPPMIDGGVGREVDGYILAEGEVQGHF